MKHDYDVSETSLLVSQLIKKDAEESGKFMYTPDIVSCARIARSSRYLDCDPSF